MLRTTRPGETLEWPEDRPKITIERETTYTHAEVRKMLDGISGDAALHGLEVVDNLDGTMGLRAALAAQPAEPVAQVETLMQTASHWAYMAQIDRTYAAHDAERKLRKQLLAALATSAAVPPGYALVPLEPTHDILCALTQEWHTSRHDAMKARYRAMLAAAGDKP